MTSLVGLRHHVGDEWSTEGMTSQKFVYIFGKGADMGSTLAQRLAAAEFAVHASKRMTGGLHVRVREGSDDESEVERIRTETAPDSKVGPSGTPTSYIPGYRAGLA